MRPILLAATLSLALFAGCASGPDEQPVADGAPVIPSVSLWPGMNTIDARPVFPEELSKAKPIHAVIDVESLAYRTITIQYRVIWFDAKGVILNPDAGFRILNMAPRRQTRLDLPDTTGSAVSWRAEFRPAM